MSPSNEQATRAAPFEKQTPWSLGKQFFAKQEPRPVTSTGSVNSRRWRALARSQRAVIIVQLSFRFSWRKL
jgi:hypothetical protein